MIREAYTDGACKGNPGRGGWAAVIIEGDEQRIITGSDPETTNNRMEMTAVIEALKEIPAGEAVTVITDSGYVVDGITKWVPGWKRRGWRTADNKPVKNRDLWEALTEEAARRTVTWKWVRGHSTSATRDSKLNNLADAHASQAARMQS